MYNNINLIPINRPDIPNKSFKEYKVTDNAITHFENQVCQYLETDEDFIMTSSGKMSLYFLFKALQLKGNIITAPLSCTMAYAPLIPLGLTFKFVDVNQNTFVLDPDVVEQSIDQDTVAILAVHLGGVSCDMEQLREIAKKHHLLLIEDCAQAFGSTYRDKKLGTFGDFSCFSFAKNMWLAGGGGVLSTNKEITAKIRAFQTSLPSPTDGLLEYRFYRDELESRRALSKEADKEYFERFLKPKKNANVGVDYMTYFEQETIQTQPSELQASILLEQLIILDKNNKRRIENANLLIDGLKDILVFQSFENGQSVYSKLYCHFKKMIPNQTLIPILMDKGIDAKHLTKSHGIHFQERLDKHKEFKDRSVFVKLKNYNTLHDVIFALPISSNMNRKEIDYIILKLHEL